MGVFGVVWYLSVCGCQRGKFEVAGEKGFSGEAKQKKPIPISHKTEFA